MYVALTNLGDGQDLGQKSQWSAAASTETVKLAKKQACSSRGVRSRLGNSPLMSGIGYSDTRFHRFEIQDKDIVCCEISNSVGFSVVWLLRKVGLLTTTVESLALLDLPGRRWFNGKREYDLLTNRYPNYWRTFALSIFSHLPIRIPQVL